MSEPIQNRNVFRLLLFWSIFISAVLINLFLIYFEISATTDESDLHYYSAFLALLLMMFGIVAYRKFAASIANCPYCGEKNPIIRDVDQCGKCKKYYKRDENYVSQISPDFIANEPVFAVHLPSGYFLKPHYLGNKCFVCGNTATQRINITSRPYYDGPGDPYEGTVSIEVPHCNLHNHGVAIENDETLLFRSYSLHLQYLDLHQLWDDEFNELFNDRKFES